MTERTDDRAILGRLHEVPRVRLHSGPTPLQPMANLAALCGGAADLMVKRDDCIELAFGGNKVRQLEFYLGAAAAADADTVLITGAVQSNFARLAAAGARKLGMECHIQLESRVPKQDPLYLGSGNVLIDRLLGATLHYYPDGEDEEGADRRIGEIAAELRATGGRPYIIPLAPGHAPLGALGYVKAAEELLAQLQQTETEIDEIVVASGSGHTHGGLLFGLRALGSPIKVTGICVRRNADRQRHRITERCREIADLLAIESNVSDDDIVLDDGYLAPGYGIAGEACLDAIFTAAQTEGLILDLTYTGKAMAGLIDRAKSAPAGYRLLFIHTGGAPALFGYQTDLDRALNARENAPD